jgi:hypothetical protein
VWRAAGWYDPLTLRVQAGEHAMANPEHIELVKQGAEAIGKWREEHPGVRLDLQKADLSEADLHEADLQEADLSGADLHGADLHGTNLRGALLIEADLHRANLDGADLHRAWLIEANLTGASLLLVGGARHVYGLETVQYTPAENTPRLSYFETCDRQWPERLLDWERLRVMGCLPLFGISYAALIFIPIVFYGLALYNENIDLVQAWAQHAVTSPDHPLHRLASLILDRLHRRPIPSLSFVLLVSTILLAVGSTLYTFFCPSRIKEFSRDQWCDLLGRSLLHYWPLAWKHRYIHLACAACYGLGGLGAAWVLLWKLGHTARFILEHSTWPWPWR